MRPPGPEMGSSPARRRVFGSVRPASLSLTPYICIANRDSQRRDCRKWPPPPGISAPTVLAILAPIPLTPRGVATRIRGSFFLGGVPKRPTGADCKSAGLRLRRFESFPLHHRGKRGCELAGRDVIGGCSSMVEPQ